MAAWVSENSVEIQHGPPCYLLAGDVHVWCCDTDEAFVQEQEWRSVLSADECQRAWRFHFARDRERFAASRFLLRRLLSEYTSIPARDLKFNYAKHGKPSLEHFGGIEQVCFNVSHSDAIAVFAFARCQELGIDVERIRPETPIEDLAQRFFSPAEQQTLFELPEEAQRSAFFQCWARKEAFLKARGDGLSFPLDQFDVSLAPGEEARILTIRGSDSSPCCWSMRSLDIIAGYAAALVVQGKIHSLLTRRWSPMPGSRNWGR
ncbi:MAG TPA: 4'-phosphopantetheinyl transferase superfamily protein [Terriglobales bacterium]|nr:4'-phosphopantetheinyl transferase superfamily protein [Terriglobales bacterium]